MNDDLSVWINARLQERGWSMRELSRRVGVSATSISDLIGGKMGASTEMCHRLASVFQVTPEFVLRKAGIMHPILNPDDLTIKKIYELVSHLSPEERLEVLEYAEFRYQREQEWRGRKASARSGVASGVAGATGITR